MNNVQIYIANAIKYKDLFIELVKKDLKLKYRNSVLGIIWSLLNPLLMMLILSVVFMALFRNEIPNFPVYVLIGRIIYQFFSEATSLALESVYSSGHLIKKVYVPKYFFPLSRVCSSFVNLLIAIILLLIVMAVTGIPFRWINIMALVVLFYLLVISSGIGLLLSAVNVFFRDIKHLYSIVLLMLMYLTPIFYPISIIPDRFMPIIMLNPLYWIVEMFRDVILYGVMPDGTDHLIMMLFMIIFGCLGLFVFYKTQDRFIYHL